MSNPNDRLLRQRLRAGLDALLADLEEIEALAGEPIEVTRSDGRLCLCLVLRQANAPPAPAQKPEQNIRENIHAPANDLPPLKGAHLRVLNHVPVGEEHRLKSGSILRAAGFPKANPYNRALITLLLKHGKVRRHPGDSKLYRAE